MRRYACRDFYKLLYLPPSGEDFYETATLAAVFLPLRGRELLLNAAAGFYPIRGENLGELLR